MKDNEISILEQYHIRVARMAIFCGFVGIIFGGIMLNIINLFGEVKEISKEMIICIDIFLIVPEILALMYLYKRIVQRGRLNEVIFKKLKIVTTLIILLNYFVFTTSIHSRELWYTIFFLSLLQALFLDMKMNIFTNAGLCVSAVLVCIVQPSELPYGNIMFQDIVVRCGVTFLIMMLITIMVYCSGQVLLNLKEQKQRWILQYVEKVDENQHQIRELKHNMKNQMIVLKSLIEENDVEEANAFIGNMIENTESLSNGIFTGNASINSILNSKINDSKRYNIDWDIEINVPRNINMGSSDIGIIIGNLLDNAIEACARIKDDNRKIKVNIESNSMNMIISVVNTKNEGEIKEKTWKTDKENHGIGLKSVQRVVNKYNGAMRNEDKGNLYDVNIILWYKGIS